MVRAAASGVVDYSRADPTDMNWRIRHHLLIEEVRRRNEIELFDAVHKHWLAYVARGVQITYEFKQQIDSALKAQQRLIYPWLKAPETETEASGQTDTINPETAKMLEKWKALQARLEAERAALAKKE